ncbi:phasin family protein [Pseudorhodoferax sp.]|uniref:phasin family protein n=1 Tax=Pseudorhodoferax sp. TaxID=1993553 RepID=UPI0039E3814D
MARKPHSFDPSGDDATAAHFGESVRASAQQVWLAGLGALAKAQAEGSRMFEALAKEGADMQRRTQAAAEERLGEAGERMSSVASALGVRAAGQWDRLEGIFEERVSKALRKLGVPNVEDLERLAARIEALERAARRPAPRKPPAAGHAASAAAPQPAPARRTARKRSAPKSP